MKIHISRQGIVIRTVEVQGNKASVGSGADCDIRIDDPYLAAHVADVVNRGGEWRIVDAATSIEGIAHNGRRVEDEPLISGERYALGAFELVAEGAAAGAAPQTSPAREPSSQPAHPVAPVTMMEDLPAHDTPNRPPIPITMFEAPVPGGLPGAAPPPPQTREAAPSGFQPITPTAPPRPNVAPAAPAAAPSKKRSKLPLILALGGLMFVLLLIVVVMIIGGGGEEVAETDTAPAPTPVVTDTAPQVSPAELGNQFASRLEIDKALEQWEAAIKAGGNDPLRARYAQVAFDAAMVYAAANDTARSRSYLERVVEFGPPDSPVVERARARIDS